ncbi:MAG: hypothetical protein GPJ51_10195, partial [Candidatus Heimdallarchaeota archaeon]|nr:hypothetical protein [Candidatus Heimdallarchaeota archaeon]
EHIERILLKRKIVHLNDLFAEFWHSYHLLTHYMQIFLIIKELEEEGKIIIDENKNISLAWIKLLDTDGIENVTIWDLEHKKEDIKEKKEIIERYSTINYLA